MGRHYDRPDLPQDIEDAIDILITASRIYGEENVRSLISKTRKGYENHARAQEGVEAARKKLFEVIDEALRTRK